MAAPISVLDDSMYLTKVFFEARIYESEDLPRGILILLNDSIILQKKATEDLWYILV